MKSTTKLLTVAGVVASLSVASAVSAQSQQPDQAPKVTQEQREEIHQAVENGDYEGWKALLTQDERGAKILEVINADNFSKLQEMHQLREDGDREGAKEIADELGLKAPRREREGKDSHFDEETREAIKAAVENGDYDTFKDLVSQDEKGEKILEKVTAENFGKFKEMHELREAGDKEGAQAIADELGIQKPHGKNHGPRFDEETREEIKTAVENGDYETFKGLVTQDGRGEKILEKVTPENFDRFKALHEAREAGDKDTAKEIAEELGIEGKRGGKFKRGGHGEYEEHGNHDHVEFGREDDEEGGEQGMRGRRGGRGNGPNGQNQ